MKLERARRRPLQLHAVLRVPLVVMVLFFGFVAVRGAEVPVAIVPTAAESTGATPFALDRWMSVTSASASGVSLRGVSFTDALRGWAVGSTTGGDDFFANGNKSVILNTVNGGATWEDQFGSSFGKYSILNGVTFTDAEHGYAVGAASDDLPAARGEGFQPYLPRQEVFATDDGGQSWGRRYRSEVITTTTDNNLRAVSCTSAQRCHAVGGKGTILGTTDGWSTAQNQVNDFADFRGIEVVHGVSFTEGPGCPPSFPAGCYGHAVGYHGRIVGTQDGGETWRTEVFTPQVQGEDIPLLDTWFVDRDTGWAVGQGKILATTDGGDTWLPQRSPNPAYTLRGVTFLDPSRGWAVGDEGVERPDPTNPRQELPLRAVILATTDGGSTWVEQFACQSTTTCQADSPDLIASSLRDVSFTQDRRTGLATGYAVGEGGTILKLSTSAIGPSVPLLAVSCTDALTCHAVGGGKNMIFATTDGGETWARQDEGLTLNRGWFGVSFTKGTQGCPPEFPSGCFGHVAGDRSVLATTDGGQTWQDRSPPSNGWNDTSFTNGPGCPPPFPQGCYGHVASSNSGIFATTDGGATWAQQFTNPVSAIEFTDHLRGHAVGTGPAATKVMRTTNGGADWILGPDVTPSGATLRDISFTGGPVCPLEFPAGCYGHAVGTEGMILATTVGGGPALGTTQPWVAQRRPDGTAWTGETLLAVSFANTTSGVAVGQRGTILTTTNGGGTWEQRFICVASSPCLATSSDRVASDVSLQDVSVVPDGAGAYVAYIVGDSGTLLRLPVEPPACGPAPTPGPGQVLYPGRVYSLVGLPQGSTVPAFRYGWFDRGDDGRNYVVEPPGQGVTGGRGYWAYFRCPTLVTVATGAASISFALGANHASMVGNPSATKTVTVTGHTQAARWVPSQNNYQSFGPEPVTLAVGEGLWVISDADTTITIG